jgi:hypothetical protein
MLAINAAQQNSNTNTTLSTLALVATLLVAGYTICSLHHQIKRNRLEIKNIEGSTDYGK